MEKPIVPSPSINSGQALSFIEASNCPKEKLLDLARELIGRKQYSKRTEESHIHWIKGIKV